MLKIKNLFILAITVLLFTGCNLDDSEKESNMEDTDVPKNSISFEESIKDRSVYEKVKDTFSVTFSATGPNLPGGIAEENIINFKDQAKWKQGWKRQFPPVSQVSTFVYNTHIVYGDITAISDNIDMSNPETFYGIIYNQDGKPITKTYYKTMDYVNFILNHKLNTDDYIAGSEISDLGKETEIYAVLYFTTKDGAKHYLKCPSLYLEYASKEI